MVDPDTLEHATVEARGLHGNVQLLLIVGDPRSLHGTMMMALCNAAPDDVATGKDRVEQLQRRVASAQRKAEDTGEIAIQYTCGPLATFRSLCEEYGGEYLALLPELDRRLESVNLVKIVAFTEDRVSLLTPHLRGSRGDQTLGSSN